MSIDCEAAVSATLDKIYKGLSRYNTLSISNSLQEICSKFGPKGVSGVQLIEKSLLAQTLFPLSRFIFLANALIVMKYDLNDIKKHDCRLNRLYLKSRVEDLPKLLLKEANPNRLKVALKLIMVVMPAKSIPRKSNWRKTPLDAGAVYEFLSKKIRKYWHKNVDSNSFPESAKCFKEDRPMKESFWGLLISMDKVLILNHQTFSSLEESVRNHPNIYC
jgi:hypothetical protein